MYTLWRVYAGMSPDEVDELPAAEVAWMTGQMSELVANREKFFDGRPIRFEFDAPSVDGVFRGSRLSLPEGWESLPTGGKD